MKLKEVLYNILFLGSQYGDLQQREMTLSANTLESMEADKEDDQQDDCGDFSVTENNNMDLDTAPTNFQGEVQMQNMEQESTESNLFDKTEDEEACSIKLSTPERTENNSRINGCPAVVGVSNPNRLRLSSFRKITIYLNHIKQ